MNDLPDNVPRELVMPFALTPRRATTVNPYTDIIPKLHEGPPIFYGTDVFPGRQPGWVVRRAEDLRKIYADTDSFGKRGNTGFAAGIGESWDIIPTELDPPRHTGFRNALNPVFSPKRMGELDGKVRLRAREYIDKFKDKGECDFVRDFAIPFPVSIFLDLLGLPQEEMQQFLDWEFSLLHTDDMEDRVKGTRAVKAYLLNAIEDRRKNPGDDLISIALQLEYEGRQWTPEEVFGHCFNLYLGGLDTVSANIGLHFHHLATHPADQDALRQNPAGATVAIEELLRAYAAVTTFRICTKDVVLHDVTIRAGDRVAMSTPLGSNDPEAFEAPTHIRFDRRPSHLTFGYGPHRCLGAHLARRELQIAMQEMLAALPAFTVQPGFDVPFYLSNIIHVESLPLVWAR
ncbi:MULTISPECIES: cytochrome P450 [Sphingomonadales]|uniref:cytochrome P450 n=1 Tax=Sphingobium cupriresistens TaxID=1132417 RepID=UPI000A72BD2E|nr:cytochrome P450 [Sphingobium cupriresistens]